MTRERLAAVRLRNQSHIRPKLRNLVEREVAKRLVAADPPVLRMCAGVIVCEPLVNLRGEDLIGERAVPVDSPQIALELRLDRAVDATLPVADGDRLPRADCSGDLRLRDARRLALGDDTTPLALAEADARLAPQI